MRAVLLHHRQWSDSYGQHLSAADGHAAVLPDFLSHRFPCFPYLFWGNALHFFCRHPSCGFCQPDWCRTDCHPSSVLQLRPMVLAHPYARTGHDLRAGNDNHVVGPYGCKIHVRILQDRPGCQRRIHLWREDRRTEYCPSPLLTQQHNLQTERIHQRCRRHDWQTADGRESVRE